MDYDNFFLPTDNLNEARKFYAETLGFPVKFDFSEKGMIAFKVADQEPAIIIQDENKIIAAKPAIVFVVDDVRETYNQLKSKGVKFLSEPYEIFTGLVVQFEDPSGNRLGITDYSKKKI